LTKPYTHYQKQRGNLRLAELATPTDTFKILDRKLTATMKHGLKKLIEIKKKKKTCLKHF
jgi:hypothetical protein